MFSVELVQFRSQHDSTFVLVGCSVDLHLRPYKAKAGCIYTFLLTSDGNRFEYIHKTPTDDVCFLFVLNICQRNCLKKAYLKDYTMYIKLFYILIFFRLLMQFMISVV